MDNYSENQERHVLIVNSGDRRAYALEAAAYSVGRDSTNAIMLDFETVSRQHALFLRVPNPDTHKYEYRIIDGNAEGKASANGVFINGEKIKSQTLKNGDSIQFGQHVKVAYLTLSMGEAEFVNYLESISYQSLKSELVDSKATMVGIGFDEMFADTPRPLSEKSPQQSSAKSRQRNSKWQETLHDYDQVAHAIDDTELGRRAASTSNKKGKSAFRLWMALALGAILVSGAGGAFFFLNASSAEKTAPAAVPSAVQDEVD